MNVTALNTRQPQGFMAQLRQGILAQRNQSPVLRPEQSVLFTGPTGADEQALKDVGAFQRDLVAKDPVIEQGALHAKQPVSTIVYNPASLDSVYAAAQLASSQLGEVECIAHSYLDSYDALLGKDHLLVCGTELSRAAMDALLKQGSGRVTLFAYAASYSWLGFDDSSLPLEGDWVPRMFSSRRYLTAWGDRLEIVRQHNNFTDKDYTEDTLFLKMDNTATTLSWQWLQRNGMSVDNTCLREGRVAAQRLSSLAFPVLSDLTRVGETPAGKEWQDDEVRNKAILHHLLGSLRSALGGVNPVAKLRDVKPNASTESYLEYWRNVGRSIQRAAGNRHYRFRSTVFSLPTMACTEMAHHDILPQAVAQRKSLVTYEDVHGLRIWRIFAKDLSVQLAVLKSLKGVEVWCEGPCLCTYTKVAETH